MASRLWQLLVVQAGLMQHLGAVKDYLLLARGDFYQCFLADAAKLLAGPPREKTANSDLGEGAVWPLLKVTLLMLCLHAHSKGPAGWR